MSRVFCCWLGVGLFRVVSLVVMLVGLAALSVGFVACLIAWLWLLLLFVVCVFLVSCFLFVFVWCVCHVRGYLVVVLLSVPRCAVRVKPVP